MTFPPPPRRIWTPPSYLRGADTPTPDSNIANQFIYPKPSLNDITIQTYSFIIPGMVIAYKATPPALRPMANVDQMTWEFDEPEHDDDHELRLYVALSAHDIAVIRRFGYQHEVLEEVPLFDAVDLQTLANQQQDELLSAADSSVRVSLQIEHEQQTAWAREQTLALTILDYLASPFRRRFEDRLQMTLGQRKLNQKLSEFKKKVDTHRGG